MGALQTLGWVALVHAPGLADEAAARLRGPQVRFQRKPVQTNAAVAAADVVVSHANVGLVCAAASAGKPQRVLPSHMERTMVARRVVKRATRHQGMRPAHGCSRRADWIEATLPTRSA